MSNVVTVSRLAAEAVKILGDISGKKTKGALFARLVARGESGRKSGEAVETACQLNNRRGSSDSEEDGFHE